SSGDMGHGTSGGYTPAEATFAIGSAGGVEPRPTLAGIGVQVSTPSDWWWVRVVPPQGQQLKVGVTYAATDQPFFSPWSAGTGQGPGLGVAENGFNCSTVGTFTLGNLRIAADGVIQQFTLSLTQSCAVVVSTPPQLIATIDFNIPRPPGSVPVATPAPATSGSSHGASPSPSVLPGLAGSPAPTAASGTSSASPSPTAAATGQPSPSSGALTALKRGALGLPATVNHRSGGSSATAGVLAGLALLVAVIVAGVARTTAKVARR
ncbi:MAG TPA: hypothetical protein VMO88_00150, partial [Acidimicrobiales bacterium]|nr:hypothetical protein [Acidimicrobiales bacterium]